MKYIHYLVPIISSTEDFENRIFFIKSEAPENYLCLCFNEDWLNGKPLDQWLYDVSQPRTTGIKHRGNSMNAQLQNLRPAFMAKTAGLSRLSAQCYNDIT